MSMLHVLLCAAVADLESPYAATFAARSAAAFKLRAAVNIMGLLTHAARWSATLLLSGATCMQSARRLQGALCARHPLGMMMDPP
jgi:hypothetical protein